MSKSIKKFLAVFFSGVLLLSACAGGQTKVETNFPTETSNKDKGIEGGTLKYGVVSDSALEGIFSQPFYQSQPDSEVLQFTHPSLLRATPNYEMDTENEGLASIEFNDDMTAATFKIVEGLTWHDGEPVTAEDLEFSYEIIAHKDYKGIRYTGAFPEIVGVDEYHEGKADKISGIEVKDSQTITINYKKPNLSIRANIWSYPTPKHIFKDIPVKDMLSSKYVRTEIIGYGPFKITDVVPGESVKFEAYEDYVLGAPKLDGIELKVVASAVVNESLKNGEIDMAGGAYPGSEYNEEALGEGVEVLGYMHTAYSYFGFKQGKWDGEKEENIVDPKAKMASKELRQAMMYALNMPEITEQLYLGLRTPATGIIIPNFTSYYDDKLKGFEFDPEKANKLLDDAGFIDVDGDGFREDQNGKELIINYATMEGATAETQSNFFIQNWAEVGLKVELLDGRPQEFNLFYERVQNDDSEIDIYEAAWQTGYDPNPELLWGPKAFSNFTRYQTEEGNAIMEAISSEKAVLDEKYRIEQYKLWQQYFAEEVPAAPTMFRYNVEPINKRVKNYHVRSTDSAPLDGMDWNLVEVTEAEPIKG